MLAAALTAREAGHSRVLETFEQQCNSWTDFSRDGAGKNWFSKKSTKASAKSKFFKTKTTHYKSAVMLEFKAARAQRMLKLLDTALVLRAAMYARKWVVMLQCICFAQRQQALMFAAIESRTL